MQRLRAPMNIDELRQLVQRKTETVKTLEALLGKEETELVALERQLEDEEERQTHEHRRYRIR
jgi:hypothetical protein